MDFRIMFLELLSGLWVSVEIFLLTLVFALPLGLLIAFGRMSRSGSCAGLCRRTSPSCGEPR